jgi:hypothetical protein
VNYDKVAHLPDFTMFTWSFLVAGVRLAAFTLDRAVRRPQTRSV